MSQLGETCVSPFSIPGSNTVSVFCWQVSIIHYNLPVSARSCVQHRQSPQSLIPASKGQPCSQQIKDSVAIGMSWFVSLCGHLIGDLTSSTCYASTIVPPAAFPSLTSLVLLMFNVDRWFRRSFKFLQLQSQQVSTSSSFAAMAIEV